ncbi:hypothetical protein DFH06DRAFT_1332639 [Mycena polygramma]|nr:hypothetical protein DFH06DRAFT_1332639 [Mycena polygramma]
MPILSQLIILAAAAATVGANPLRRDICPSTDLDGTPLTGSQTGADPLVTCFYGDTSCFYHIESGSLASGNIISCPQFIQVFRRGN